MWRSSLTAFVTLPATSGRIDSLQGGVHAARPQRPVLEPGHNHLICGSQACELPPIMEWVAPRSAHMQGVGLALQHADTMIFGACQDARRPLTQPLRKHQYTPSLWQCTPSTWDVMFDGSWCHHMYTGFAICRPVVGIAHAKMYFPSHVVPYTSGANQSQQPKCSLAYDISLPQQQPHAKVP